MTSSETSWNQFYDFCKLFATNQQSWNIILEPIQLLTHNNYTKITEIIYKGVSSIFKNSCFFSEWKQFPFAFPFLENVQVEFSFPLVVCVGRGEENVDIITLCFMWTTLKIGGGGSPTEFCLVSAVVYLINNLSVLVKALRNFLLKKSHHENRETFLEWSGWRKKGVWVTRPA